MGRNFWWKNFSSQKKKEELEWCNKWANYYHDAERALSKQQHSHRETHPRSICLGCQVCFTLLYFLKSHLSIYSFSFTTSSHRRHSPTSYNEINCDNNFLSSIRMFCSLLFIRFLSTVLEQFYDFIVRSKINCEIIHSIDVWHDATCILVCTSFRLQRLGEKKKGGVKTHASKLQFCADETSKSCTNFENGITMSFCMASARAKECTLHND